MSTGRRPLYWAGRFSVLEYKHISVYCRMCTSLFNISNATVGFSVSQRVFMYEIAVGLPYLEATYVFATTRRSKPIHGQEITGDSNHSPSNHHHGSRAQFLN